MTQAFTSIPGWLIETAHERPVALVFALTMTALTIVYGWRVWRGYFPKER